MKSASSEESKSSEQTMSSGATSSTGNQAVTSPADHSVASGTGSRRRRNSSDSFDSIRSRFENNQESQLPKYVSTGPSSKTPERRPRRTRSNKSQVQDSLRAVDSDEIAQ
jgi:hypothetical protein